MYMYVDLNVTTDAVFFPFCTLLLDIIFSSHDAILEEPSSGTVSHIGVTICKHNTQCTTLFWHGVDMEMTKHEIT